MKKETKQDYRIDQVNGTVTYTDPHTGIEQHATIAEVLEMFFWLRSREDTIRRMLSAASPVQVASKMQLRGEHYYGVTEDRYIVKVEKARYEQVLQEHADNIRRSWVERNKLVNTMGVDLAPGQERNLTLSDCPDGFVQSNVTVIRVSTPEWWLHRPDNLELGTRLKLP